jgi:hypothetical protein
VLEVDTIDEHLRALARMSLHFGHRPFEKIVIRMKANLGRM